MAFGGDGQHPLDGGGMLGVGERGVAEQRVDGGESPVARADAVAPVFFEVVEERDDQRGVEVGDVERGRCLGCSGGGETEEESEGAAVGGDRVRRRVALCDQPVSEERLQHRGEGGHGLPASCWPRRAAASCISSGTELKYQ